MDTRSLRSISLSSALSSALGGVTGRGSTEPTFLRKGNTCALPRKAMNRSLGPLVFLAS